MGARGPKPSGIIRRRAWSKEDIVLLLDLNRADILTDKEIAATMHRTEMDVVMKLYALNSGSTATGRISRPVSAPEPQDIRLASRQGIADALPAGHPLTCAALGIQPWWSGIRA